MQFKNFKHKTLNLEKTSFIEMISLQQLLATKT